MFFRKKLRGRIGKQAKKAFNKLPLVAMVTACPVNNNHE